MDNIVVLDTSVLVSDSHSLFSFPKQGIYIPMTVVNELDGLKKRSDDVGRNAREVIKTLELLSKDGSLSDGIKLDNKSVLKIVPEEKSKGKDAVNDDAIINTALAIKKKAGTDLILVTQDLNMRVKARVLGLTATAFDYVEDREITEDFYSGVMEIFLSPNEIEEFYMNDKIIIDEKENLYPNQIVIMKANNGSKGSAIGIHKQKGLIQRISEYKKVCGIKPKNKEQQFALQLLMNPDIHLVTLFGNAGTGKAQPLDAKILTPNGWITMGKIEVGDKVISKNGKSSTVLGVFPQGLKDIYKVNFTDGTSTECCDDHLWETKTSLDREYSRSGSVKSLKEIRSSLRYKGEANHSIPLVDKVEFRKQELPLSPYLLGFLLGGGDTSFNSLDEELAEKVSSLLPDSLGRLGKLDYNCTTQKPNYSNSHHAECTNVITRTDELKEILASLEISDLAPENKFIPEIYKLSCYQDRIELLQGILDVDRTAFSNGDEVHYSTFSEKLSEDVAYLIQSLGGVVKITKNKACIHKEETLKERDCYEMAINLPLDIAPFTLSKKMDEFKLEGKRKPCRYIASVDYVGKKEAQCILIDSPDHLYVTDDFIVTHNTLIALAAALQQLEDGIYDRIIITKPMVPVGRDLGFLPGSKEEKLAPWMGSIDDNLRFLLDDREYDKLMTENKIVFEALSLFRGRSLPHSIILVDESQNTNKVEAKTIVTRAGEGSKVVMTADVDQIDNSYVDSVTNGASHVVEKLKNEPLVGHITLIKGERSALATVAAKVL